MYWYRKSLHDLVEENKVELVYPFFDYPNYETKINKKKKNQRTTITMIIDLFTSRKGVLADTAFSILSKFSAT
jgi:hypothetical protein